MELDDWLFEVPQSAVGLKEGLSAENLKRFQKDAKVWVRENAADSYGPDG